MASNQLPKCFSDMSKFNPPTLDALSTIGVGGPIYGVDGFARGV